MLFHLRIINWFRVSLLAVCLISFNLPAQLVEFTGAKKTAAPLLVDSGTNHLRYQGRAIDHMDPMKPYLGGLPRSVAPDNYWGLVQLFKVMPPEASLGQDFAYDLRATALQNVGNVVITDRVPAGATYVRSEPSAQVSGDQLQWRLNDMDAGTTQNIKVWLRAEKEGQLNSCATVAADYRVCAGTLVGRPVLALDKTGPASALLNADVNYNLVVANRGTSLARGVVVTDNIPDGLTHSSGQSQLNFNVGDLAPGQSKQIPVTLHAAKRGKTCNTATATASNAAKVEAEACTTIVQPGLSLTKNGPSEQYMGKNAPYQIVVANTGDTTLTRLVITDTAPADTRFVEARDATISGNQAVWQITELAPGAKQNFTAILTSLVPGQHCNAVTIKSAEGLTGNANACTLWKGYAGLLLQMVDTVDPIQIGEATEYVITITNQGTAADSNIKVRVKFPAEISPLTATGVTVGSVDGQSVTFAPLGTLAPKQSVKWTVRAKGAAVGDARTTVDYTSDLIIKPVIKEESTHVY